MASESVEVVQSSNPDWEDRRKPGSPYLNGLVSKEEFKTKIAELEKKHEWLLQGKSLDIRPGWITEVDLAFEKVRSVLSAADLKKNRIFFLYSQSRPNFKIVLDSKKRVSKNQREAINSILNKLAVNVENTCPMCGDTHTKTSSNSEGCFYHSAMKGAGDFLEDFGTTEWVRLKNLEIESKAKPSTQEKKSKLDNRPRLKLFDHDQVRAIWKTKKVGDRDHQNRFESLVKRLLERSEESPFSALPKVAAIDKLIRKYPNFADFLLQVKSSVLLAKVGNGIFEMPPTLLVGPAGVGKTMVACEVANILNTAFLELRMENEQNGGSLMGTDEHFSNTKTGRLFELLVGSDTANPMVLVDEIDKASQDDRYNVLSGLYSLLERRTARRFEDLSLRGLKLDASGVIWVMTANDERSIPTPILNRMIVHHIRKPTHEESLSIARNIYSEMRETKAWGKHFPARLTRAVEDQLTAVAPRQMQSHLMKAFGKAVLNARDHLTEDDLALPKPNQGIGFLG